MENQNIFDNKVFFDSYMNLRDGANFNDLLEQPAMRALLPDISGMDILDIGCGFGANCLEFSYKAHSVTGIDISQRMLEVAEKMNCGGNIKYMKLSMEDTARSPSITRLTSTGSSHPVSASLKKAALCSSARRTR